MNRRLGLVFLVVVACALWACGGKKKPGIAELTKADGPVERQEGAGSWAGAAVGAQFFLGDAARTGDGAAELKLTGTQQLIAMNAHTVLRFGPGKANSTNIKVELGGIDVINSSNVQLLVGDVTIAPGGKIHITSSKVELLIGTAQVQGADGKLVDLVIGTPFSFDIGPVAVLDAAVPDAAPPDAAPAVAGDVEYEITGKGVEVQGPNDKTWTPAAEGKGSVPLGAKLRLKKAGAKAKLVSGSTTLELSGASTQITVKENLVLGLELGTGVATVPAATEGKVGVPGGDVELKGLPTAPAEARIDVNARGEAKVAMVHGTGKLVTPSTSLEVAGGESATVLKAGTINPGVVIPKYFDFQVKVGEAPRSFWVHDPKGSTALQFAFNGKCPNGGTIEADHDARFKTPRVSEGKETANMLLVGGSWAWRLRCTGGNIAANGQVVVVRDNGRRPLPPKPTKNSIDADGRNYTISYQSLIPIVEVHYTGTGSAFKLHLATGGSDEVFEGQKPVIEIPGTKLKEGNYTFWFEKDGVKQDKVTSLKITFDQTAAQVYIESPTDGQPFEGDVEVAGAALPGWTAHVDAVEIPVIDTATRRFKAKVPAPSGGAQALAIRLSHAQRGIHFYLRRGSK